MLLQAVIHVLYTIRCEWNLVLTCGQGRLLLTHNMTCFLIDNLACDTLQFYQSYVSALLYEDSPLIAIVPKGILPQSYDNRAFWHDFQGILISYMEAYLALKLHSLKLRSLNG